MGDKVSKIKEKKKLVNKNNKQFCFHVRIRQLWWPRCPARRACRLDADTLCICGSRPARFQWLRVG